MLLAIMTTLTSMMMMYASMLLMSNSMIMHFNFNIISLYSWSINVSLMMDWMSSMFIATVTLITSSILIFSNKYIKTSEKTRFSLILLLFVTSMILLIASDNIIFMLLGWDGLGLTSYILVMTYQDQKSTKSGTITMMSNRVGDVLILLAISTMFMSGDHSYTLNNYFSLTSMTLIILASFTKSAQIPFSAWLPEAMAAPTPISALVHSSTLVTAGVYILLRMYNSSNSMLFSLVSSVSIMTMFLSGLSANWEKDLKKIIALSTLSQIAMMMYVISLKKMNVAFFHLLTHALFKSTLFLSAGFLIYSVANQDSRPMSLHSMNSPMLSSALGTSNLALMGLPFMSGFYSKDMILESMLSSNFNYATSTVMLIAIGLTTSYSMRMIMMISSNNIKMTEFNFNNNNNMTLAILLMILFSVYSGSTLSWLLPQSQPFLMPLLLKISIPLSILLGLTLGTLLNFNNYIYMKMGLSALKLWFLANLSSVPFMKLTNFSTTMKNLDMSWHETTSVKTALKINLSLSKLPLSMMTSMAFITLMLTLLPIMI